ncbi:hypothetical protein KP509_15G031300 [Ceratopteris richardii]|uniref:Uncharacterized protein n=1 Tax=Ceratopteris richardii TaxID=49495 RepID=A0A8T2T273_CERRI|nr:hypothetical protein KP509_15G031300 [Ceratopteris richardii]
MESTPTPKFVLPIGPDGLPLESPVIAYTEKLVNFTIRRHMLFSDLSNLSLSVTAHFCIHSLIRTTPLFPLLRYSFPLSLHRQSPDGPSDLTNVECSFSRLYSFERSSKEKNSN